MNVEIQNPRARGWGRLLSIAAACAISLVWCVTGCKREAGPPPPLSAEKIAPEMQKAFALANKEVKDLIGEIDLALKSKDYAAAFERVQVICNLPEATPEQRSVSVRASLTLTELLRAATAQGDPNAAAALKRQQQTR